VVLVVSPLLMAELGEVLHRDRFRRYITTEEAQRFIEAIGLLAEHADDPPTPGWAPICRDPDDDYLVAVAEVTAASFLVSGDRDLLELDRPGLDVRSPREAVDAVVHRHPWGDAFVPGDAAVAFRQARAEGHDTVLKAAAVFLALLEDAKALALLSHIVTPESRDAWEADLATVRDVAAARTITSRAEYPSPDVAYVKLPPDPGETVKASSPVVLEDTVILTLQRRPALPDPLGLGGWRVHGLGDYIPPEDMPPAE
jgi:putative PIN family toxin of toxin-antitoxin system